LPRQYGGELGVLLRHHLLEDDFAGFEVFRDIAYQGDVIRVEEQDRASFGQVETWQIHPEQVRRIRQLEIVGAVCEVDRCPVLGIVKAA
jgi:hypothetical protein